jgi:probable rRNA maturation factor
MEIGSSMRLQLSIQKETRARGVPRAASFDHWARAALTGSGPGTAAVTVRLVEGRESAALNRRYRKKAGPTNVLSFTYELPRGSRGLLGDLVICAPLVAREAAAQGKARRAHWAHMIVHGIMHLRGFDHIDPREAGAMEAAESRILKHLGFPDPYR